MKGINKMSDKYYNLVEQMVQDALNHLGECGEITDIYAAASLDRWVVEVDGEYFGIYDTTRKTFVD